MDVKCIEWPNTCAHIWQRSERIIISNDLFLALTSLTFSLPSTYYLAFKWNVAANTSMTWWYVLQDFINFPHGMEKVQCPKGKTTNTISTFIKSCLASCIRVLERKLRHFYGLRPKSKPLHFSHILNIQWCILHELFLLACISQNESNPLNWDFTKPYSEKIKTCPYSTLLSLYL